MRLTGGCQCGAVRYEITDQPDHATICHCRMCQKAMGGAYLASASLRPDSFAWTRGAAALFRSSSAASRAFCAACGTPLAFVDERDGNISVALGTLDDPEAVIPDRQIGVESRRSWWRGDGTRDERTTIEDAPDFVRGLQSFQHPDHDTAEWPARG